MNMYEQFYIHTRLIYVNVCKMWHRKSFAYLEVWRIIDFDSMRYSLTFEKIYIFPDILIDHPKVPDLKIQRNNTVH